MGNSHPSDMEQTGDGINIALEAPRSLPAGMLGGLVLVGDSMRVFEAFEG